MNRHTVKSLALAAALIISTVNSAARGQQPQARATGISVAVIAPSVSTTIEARRIIAREGWTEGKMKTSDAILVVVRSELSFPLRLSYSFIGELKEDADQQLNIAGSAFHVYLYRLGADLDCTELKHVSYKAD